MKTRLAKKIWKRAVNRLPGYWYDRIWDYCADLKRDHRIDKAKIIAIRDFERRKKKYERIQHRLHH